MVDRRSLRTHPWEQEGNVDSISQPRESPRKGVKKETGLILESDTEQVQETGLGYAQTGTDDTQQWLRAIMEAQNGLGWKGALKVIYFKPPAMNRDVFRWAISGRDLLIVLYIWLMA
ncbi:hypothetical protein BTVI_128697 [Pitangus sulphuratus]|nr:hypothetical protein BTVI_128697 [Pitangus sulphuratus]